MERKRVKKSISIDPLVWQAIEIQAQNRSISPSRWIEDYLFENLQKVGVIGIKEHKLGENRGGKR